MKLLKWLSALFVAYLMVLGFSTETVVEATMVGNLKRERSSYVGRMEFRHPQGTQNTWEDYMIFTINGEAVFCLDPATYAYEGRYVGEEFKDVEQITARVKITKQLLDKLMLITYYGYQVNPNHKNYHYTQALIWETIGYAARSFNGGLSLSEYRSWKANVMAKVNSYEKTTSFDGQTHTLSVGQNVTLTDTHNVLQNLTIPASQNGYTFKRNGNQLTITATKDAKDGNIQFTQPRDNRIHGNSILYKKPGSQTVASLKLRDPQSADVTLKAIKNAHIQVTKTSSTTGKVMADVEFTLYDATTNKAIQTVKTDKNGVAQFTNLEAGRKFYMKETRTQKGYMLNETRYDYTAVAGETKRFNVKNEPVPTMTSTATNASGGKTAFWQDAQKETVTIKDVVPNQTYKLVSFAMVNAGKTKWKEQTITFTPKATTHSHTFTYTGVSKGFTGNIVYGAKLYKGNKLIAEHYDWNNKNQTVTVIKPAMTSVATSDKGEKQVFYHQAHKETVNVTGLIPNQQYKLVSFAMTQYGKWKEQTINFTPKTNTHQHTFTYTGVANHFTGNVVYGAKLYLGNTLLSEHYDWNNKNQTVTVIKPTIVTVATTENGQKTGYRDEKHLEKATVTNVLPNRTYTLVAKQYTSSGRLLTSQTRQITPKTSTHTETFTFTVPNGVAGNIVYAQELLLDGKQVANHFDLKNKSQTVFVDEPHIETIATTTQGRKVGYSHEDHKEEAELTGLIVGRTYRLVATQYDKTGKAYATQTRTFKADKKERVETFTFSVPTGFTGHLVYGQVLYDEDSQVAVHYDLENTLQTVTVVDPSMTSNATSLTGEKTVFAYDKHKEVVDVAGLIPNQAYKLVSFQMNAQTKQKMSEQVITFTPTSALSSHTFNYTVPQGFSGDVVYGATLYVGNELIDEHFDWNNKKQTVTVVKPTITTKATTVSGAKLGYDYEDHKEVAVMTDLIRNGEYEVVATQYDKTGKVYASQTATFTATESTYTHEFTFSVPKGFKGHLVYGETLSYKGQVIATHYDLENKEQTVEIITPDITTKATTQSGDKVGYTFEDHIEVAELTGLIIGRKYEVVATQYDETGKVYANQSREFIADTTERTEEFTFTVPKGFTGTIVYGEDLYTDGKKIAVHFDLKSIPQSVKVVEPSITTKATTVSGAKLGYDYEDHKEVAVLTNLIPNREYEVVATQYDKTGKVYASQTATFTAKENTYTHEFTFSVPKGFKGHLVYGETLSYKGQVIATHYDLENKEQTVEIITPDITTKATTQSGDKVGYTFEDHIEVAELTGLIIGRKYEVVATQYDETGKVYANQSREFIADTTERTEAFTFTVPKGFTGTIVYGEDLYTDGKKIAVHFDLKSIPQSVKVVEPTIKTQAKVNGKTTMTQGQKVTVTDTLTYSNFKNAEVAIKTWVVKYGTNEKVSEVYTRIVTLNGNGEVTVTLDGFDTSKLPAGKYTLMEQVFEVKDGKVTDKLIAEHVDNKDEKQTFTVIAKPELPKTGSVDNTAFFVIGTLLIALSGVLVGVKGRQDN